MSIDQAQSNQILYVLLHRLHAINVSEGGGSSSVIYTPLPQLSFPLLFKWLLQKGVGDWQNLLFK